MKASKKPDTFPIVAIGASAGGLKAFEELLNALPAESGMAIVLVPHLAPQYKSHLTEILGRNTTIRVSEVKDGEKVLPDRIYILPPNRAMRIREGILHLSSSGRRSEWRNPIDSFFRSLAADQGDRAMGVLLSGEGSDGTEGLRAIKEGGGTTFAQDRKTAAHQSMPHSAVVAGLVDFVLSPAQIGKSLGSMRDGGARHRAGKEKRSEALAGGALNKILELLRTSKGVEFEHYKRNTLLRRIQRRMELKRVRDPELYCRALAKDSEELERLYGDLLISVTSFFRDPKSFRTLKSEVYPRLLRNRSVHAPIRIWVSGCSTGEEAYSHAMNLIEFIGTRVSRFPFHIFATDVNPSVVEKARAGRYPRKIEAEVSPERLRRFFVKTEDGYRIAPFIREHCVFAVQNLMRDPPFTNLDLVSCRNLLIYLGPAIQEKVLRIFQYALKPKGILMLGGAEDIGEFAGRFAPLGGKGEPFFERTPAASVRLDFLAPNRFPGRESILRGLEHGESVSRRPAADALDLRGDLGGILPARYIPNGVIVNGELEILRFLGDTSPYLRPAPGKPGMNLRRMASGELLLELRAALHAAKQSGCVVRKEISVLLPSGTPERIRIEILPSRSSDPRERCFVVLFEKTGAAKPETRRAGGTRREKDGRRIIELKENLAVSGLHLKAVIEEQESTNAKLITANEELLSSNEELQSLNEEFETAKEELQSTNEELLTSAEEVRRKNEVLNRANDDLTNLLANIDIPVVLLGSDLSVRRFTPSAEKVLHLTEHRVGHPIFAHQLPLRISNLKRLIQDVIRSGCAHELEVQDELGHWYCLYLRPYRTDKGRTEGAVMALIDIHGRKLSEKTMLRLATVVRDSNDAIIIRDVRGRILAWNKGAKKMYGYTETEALGMNIRRLLPKRRSSEAEDLAQAVAEEREGEPLAAQRRTKDGRILDVLYTVTTLRDEAGRPAELATTERDITKQNRANRELRRMHARVIAAQDTERKRLSRELHDGVGQMLTGVKLRLESLPGELALKGKGESEILRVGAALDSAIAEVRRVSQNLMPSELEDFGLESGLLTLCREFKERSGIHVTLRTERVPRKLPPELALALFRIAQEAINNIGKHSKATMAAIAVSRNGGEIVLSVSDNGVGFSVGGKRLLGGRGLGIGNMRERAEAVGGVFELHPTPGVGTSLSVRVPLSCREGDPR